METSAASKTSLNKRTKGTSSPASIIAWSSLPFALPDATSALKRSPEEKCVKPYWATILSHWVPLPEPGPPAHILGDLDIATNDLPKIKFRSSTWKFFSRGGQCRYFAYFFQVVGDATQMDVYKKENIQCYGNTCIQRFHCKKTLQWANVCFGEHGFFKTELAEFWMNSQQTLNF